MIKAMKKSCNTIFMIVKKIPVMSQKTSNVLKPFSIKIDMHFGEKILLKYGNSSLRNSFNSLVFRCFELYWDKEPNEEQLNAGTHINNYINRFISNKSIIKIENPVFKYLTKNNTPLYFNAVQYVNKEIKVPGVLNGAKLDHYLTSTVNTAPYFRSVDIKAADLPPKIRRLDFINRLHINIFKKIDSKKQPEVTKRYFLQSIGNSKPLVMIQDKMAGNISKEQFIYHSKEEVNALGYLPNLEQGKPERIEYVNNYEGLIDRHENISGVLNIEHHQKTFLKDINEIHAATNYNSKKMNLVNLHLLSNYSLSAFVNYSNRRQTRQGFKEIHSGILGKSTRESPEKRKRHMPFENLIESKAFEFVKNQSRYKTSRMDMVSDEQNSLDIADHGFEILKKRGNTGRSLLVSLINKSAPIGVIQGGINKEFEWSDYNSAGDHTKNIGLSDSQNMLTFRKISIKETVQPSEESRNPEIHIKEDAINRTYPIERETQNLKEFGYEEINLLADKVFKALEKRIAIKKDKKGVW